MRTNVNTVLARTLILTSAVLATSAAARADSQAVVLSPPPAVAAGSPVRVDGLTFTIAKLQENNMLPAHIVLSFTNERATPATDVVFGLLDGRHRTMHQYDETGTFSQGAQIVKELPFDSVLDRQLTAAEVIEVTFADGTVWEKPAPIAPPSRRQASF